MEQYLTPKDLQELLQIGRNKSYKLCELKGFPSIKIGNTYRIDKSRLEKWLSSHEGMSIYIS